MEMQVPFGFYEISLWLAISAIITIITSELINPFNSENNIIIEKSRLKSVSLILGLLFLFTVAIRTYQIIMTL